MAGSACGRGRVELLLRLHPDGATVQLIPTLERRDGFLRSVGLTSGAFMPRHGGDGDRRSRAAR
jgi:hypothetical protein